MLWIYKKSSSNEHSPFNILQESPLILNLVPHEQCACVVCRDLACLQKLNNSKLQRLAANISLRAKRTSKPLKSRCVWFSHLAICSIIKCQGVASQVRSDKCPVKLVAYIQMLIEVFHIKFHIRIVVIPEIESVQTQMIHGINPINHTSKRNDCCYC